MAENEARLNFRSIIAGYAPWPVFSISALYGVVSLKG